jgi:hypothetical protein
MTTWSVIAQYSRRKKSIERNPRPSDALESGIGGEGWRTKKLLLGETELAATTCLYAL